MIEVKRSSTTGPYKILIGDESFSEINVNAFVAAEGRKVFIKDRELSRKAVSNWISEISEDIRLLELRPEYDFLGDSFHQGVSISRSASGLLISWDMYFYVADWHWPFTIRQYVDEFTRRLDNCQMTWEIGGLPESGFSILFAVENAELTITEEFYKRAETIRNLHEETITALKLSGLAESVSMIFEFPEEVRVPCEQYLLYFAQFLKDLGVEANTVLTHESGQVLFRVTPQNKAEALDKIRGALETYLLLSSSPVDAENESIAAQRLEASILRLRSDLKLASAELQAKEATIEAQRVIINVQKSILSGKILVDSMKDITPKAEEKEQLLDGLVALSIYKQKGVEINLGELLRRLKRMFAKDEP